MIETHDPRDELAWLGRLASGRLDAAMDRIAEMQQRGADRDDIAGVQLLLRTLTLMASQTRRLVDREIRAGQADPSFKDAHITNVRTALVQLEQVFGRAFEALISPPERDFVAFVQPYIRLARDITGDEATELIFEAGEGFGYSVWSNVFEDVEAAVDLLAPELSRSVASLPALALVSYPSRADAESFMHSVVAHEVAHLALTKTLVGEPLSPADAAFEEAAPHLDVAEGDIESRQKEIERLRDWLDELLSDVLAVRMIGPAFLLALTEYLYPTHEPNTVGAAGVAEDEDDVESHPPPAWRLQRLVAEVTAFWSDGSGEALSAAHGALEATIALVPDYALESEDARRDYAFLENVLDTLEPRLDEIVGSARYPRGRFQRDLPLVWDKLDQDIAPAERIRGRRASHATPEDEVPRQPDDPDELAQTSWSEPIDWRSILNGGYLYYLHHALKLDPPTGKRDERRRSRTYSNSLIRGSIELSELHRAMIALSDQFDVLNPPKAPGP